jgi:glycosyltransferase involved in cell wall biosynthesis
VPLLLIVYGIDAWQPSRSKLANYSVRCIDDFVAVSETTRDRFLRWTRLGLRGKIVPPSVDLTLFRPGTKRADLLERYGLTGRKILMTVGRLVTRERYKGFDEVLGVLPSLIRHEPTIAYMIVGEGDDRRRLLSRAIELGIQDRVIFAGYVPESEKADYYRLADVYVMPSRGEGFGIVFLEAMACGIPVVASSADASREAVRDGILGRVVNPDSPEEICNAVLQSLKFSERRVPAGLEDFSYDRFVVRWHDVVDRVFSRGLNTGS